MVATILLACRVLMLVRADGITDDAIRISKGKE